MKRPAWQSLFEIQSLFPQAEAIVDEGKTEIVVPNPYRESRPIVLGSARDFDTAAVLAITFLGDLNPEFAKRSKVYGEWVC